MNGVIHRGGEWFCMSPPPLANTILDNEEEVAVLLKIAVKQMSKYVAIVKSIIAPFLGRYKLKEKYGSINLEVVKKLRKCIMVIKCMFKCTY